MRCQKSWPRLPGTLSGRTEAAWCAALPKPFCGLLFQAPWTPLLERVQHMLRKSWSGGCYDRWQGQSRVDSNECAAMPYNDNRVKQLRYLELSSHELAVVGGATVFPARCQVMVPSTVLGCPYCESRPELATWAHCTWKYQRALRPAGMSVASCGDVLLSPLRMAHGETWIQESRHEGVVLAC